MCCKDTTNCLKFSSFRRPFLTLITRCWATGREVTSLPKAPHMKLRNCKRDAAAEIGSSRNLNPPDPRNRFLKQTRAGPRQVSGSSRPRIMAGLVDTAMCIERSNRAHRLSRIGLDQSGPSCEYELVE